MAAITAVPMAVLMAAEVVGEGNGNRMGCETETTHKSFTTLQPMQEITRCFNEAHNTVELFQISHYVLFLKFDNILVDQGLTTYSRCL